MINQYLSIGYLDIFDGLWQFSFWGYLSYEGMRKKKEQNTAMDNLPTVWTLEMMEIWVYPEDE